MNFLVDARIRVCRTTGPKRAVITQQIDKDHGYGGLATFVAVCFEMLSPGQRVGLIADEGNVLLLLCNLHDIGTHVLANLG